jgi:hypothetical protein
VESRVVAGESRVVAGESRVVAGERSGAQTARARMERGGGIERAGVGGEGGQASSRGTPARSWIDGICKYL